MHHHMSNENVAVHEAGHAVAATLLRLGIDHVSIEPRPTDRGYVRLTSHGFRRPHAKIAARGGGLAAERLLTVQTALDGAIAWKHAGRDYEQSMNIAFDLEGDAEQATFLVLDLWDAVHHMLAQPRHLAAVKAVAAALLQHRVLRGQQVRHIVRTTMN